MNPFWRAYFSKGLVKNHQLDNMYCTILQPFSVTPITHNIHLSKCGRLGGINIDNPGKISDFYDLGKTLGAELKLLEAKKIQP